MSKAGKWLKAAVLPVLVLAVCLLISSAQGTDLFGSELSRITFVRAAVNVLLVTFALSINLNSGRFDFSIGSVALLSSVISAMITAKTNAGPLAMLAMCAAIGGLLGLGSGLVYVTVKLPPIIVSLAIALFYEGMAFTLTQGHGVSFASNTRLLGFGTILNYTLIAAAAVILMIVIFDHTRFGYEYKALVTGQKVAVSTGIDEKRNALGCYAIAGVLMGVQGFVSATNNGAITMSLNFGSISPMFMAFLPMFVGGYIGRFINDKLGYLTGALCSALISLVYVRLNVSSSTQQIISALLMVGFLIWLNNEGRLKQLFRRTA